MIDLIISVVLSTGQPAGNVTIITAPAKHSGSHYTCSNVDPVVKATKWIARVPVKQGWHCYGVMSEHGLPIWQRPVLVNSKSSLLIKEVK